MTVEIRKGTKEAFSPPARNGAARIHKGKSKHGDADAVRTGRTQFPRLSNKAFEIAGLAYFGLLGDHRTGRLAEHAWRIWHAFANDTRGSLVAAARSEAMWLGLLGHQPFQPPEAQR